MKWRDRISILSRKRNRRSVVGQPNGTTSTNLPSGSGVPRETAVSASNSASRESVETTLSQLRPVIGPDHKSYYILLRGNGDLFTCIQPAKNVIHSLDDMMKNVMSSVKSAKLPEVTAHPKRSRPSQTKTYSTSALHKHSVGSRRNGVQAVLLGEGETQVGGVRLEDVFVTREEDISGVDSVVENVLANRTVPQVNSEGVVSQQARTGVLMHQPTVQSRLVSQTSTNNNIVKQEQSLLLSQDCVEESSESSVLLSSQDLLRATLSAPLRKKKTSCQTKVTNGLEGHLGQTIPNTSAKGEASDNSLSSVLASMGQNTLQELRLISKEGTVLTEQEIAAQIKTLIETEQLIVGEDMQIIVLRVSEREVIVKLVLSEVQVKPMHNEIHVKTEVNQDHQQQQRQQMQQIHQQKQQEQQQQLTQPHSQRNFIKKTGIKLEPVVKEEVTISPCLSPVPEDDCFTQDVLVSRPAQDSDLDYFFSAYTEGKQAFEGIRGISLDPNCVLETLAEPLVDSLVNTTQQQQQDELEKLSCEVGDLDDLGQSLLEGTGEIVVFQREDGILVNQDGIPISNELQYLIANSQQDLTTSLESESQSNHILVPPDAFEDHTVDINCEL